MSNRLVSSSVRCAGCTSACIWRYSRQLWWIHQRMSQRQSTLLTWCCSRVSRTVDGPQARFRRRVLALMQRLSIPAFWQRLLPRLALIRNARMRLRRTTQIRCCWRRRSCRRQRTPARCLTKMPRWQRNWRLLRRELKRSASRLRGQPHCKRLRALWACRAKHLMNRSYRRMQRRRTATMRWRRSSRRAMCASPLQVRPQPSVWRL